jgi:hypothetical protein
MVSAVLENELGIDWNSEGGSPPADRCYDGGVDRSHLELQRVVCGGSRAMSERTEIAEQLSGYLRVSGGNYAFQLLCSAPGCYRQGTVSVAKHALSSERHKRKTAEKLAAQGWTCPSGPLCPDHSVGRRPATK